MRIGEAFPSSYVKVEDLKGRKVVVTIDRVDIETLGRGQDQEQKPVVYFTGSDKGLALNRTNANTITELLGTDETDEWHGKRICLYPDKTDFQGKRVPCIRVCGVPTQQQRQAPPPPPPPQDDTLSEGFVASDDDVPFSVALAPFVAPLLGLLGLGSMCV